MTSKIGPPDKPLPYSEAFSSADEYVDSLLNFLGTHNLLRTLCGGVHILDFFTSTPDLYPRVLPQEWRDWFDITNITDILDLLMREDIDNITTTETWRNGPLPPSCLLDYIRLVRKHLLNREPSGSHCSRNRKLKSQKLARHVAVGMNVKKVHEVGLFASYLDDLTASYSSQKGQEISHLVDFGSGQNYLGRALASEPFNQNIVAIESRQANAERAKEFDIMAKLATKEKILRNKKLFRETGLHIPPTPPPEKTISAPPVEVPPGGTGTILYIDHRIQDGDLSDVIAQIPSPSMPSKSESEEGTRETNLMVMSLHSCGNLVHHGLRSLTINPSVKVVALVGCCYNLLTERLGPATYKLPSLRPAAHPRLSNLAEARDPHGFPMSEKFCKAYSSRADELGGETEGKGVRLNITSRMMAVQAPANWGEQDSEKFFTRHFYRAVLQRIFMDYGIVGPPKGNVEEGVSPAGHSSGGTPIVIGSLRKACYTDFVSYVRGALEKLMGGDPNGERSEPNEEPVDANGEPSAAKPESNIFRTKMSHITDEEILSYERKFASGKKDLSVIWSLMAFSAGVIEAAIVVDRWKWLQEQEEVAESWVEAVFEYGMSPRNLVVVGVKK